MLVVTTTLLAQVVIAGILLAASRDALPGDGLYGIKRVAEAVGQSLTFDESAKAGRQLELATLRLDEVVLLTGHRDVGAETLAAAGRDVGSAARAG